MAAFKPTILIFTTGEQQDSNLRRRQFAILSAVTYSHIRHRQPQTIHDKLTSEKYCRSLRQMSSVFHFEAVLLPLIFPTSANQRATSRSCFGMLKPSSLMTLTSHWCHRQDLHLYDTSISSISTQGIASIISPQ